MSQLLEVSWRSALIERARAQELQPTIIRVLTNSDLRERPGKAAMIAEFISSDPERRMFRARLNLHQ
jgi:hypothetical protein